MTTFEDLISDFDSQRSKVLLLRMDDRCFNVEFSYVPFSQVTDFVSDIHHIQTIIQFIIFETDEYDAVINTLVTIYKADGEKFRIQTMYIKITRVISSISSEYADIFPPKLERKAIQLKNIRRLSTELKSFDNF